MARVTALDAPLLIVSGRFAVVLRACPDFETAGLRVSYLLTCLALCHISLLALCCFVASLVALEAKLGSAFETVMLVTSTEDALRSAALVGALLRHVAELLAIVALDRRV